MNNAINLAKKLLSRNVNLQSAADPELKRLSNMFLDELNQAEVGDKVNLLSDFLSFDRSVAPEMQVITTSPFGLSRGRETKAVLFEIVERANDSIIVCGYHVSEPRFLEKLNDALKRGVSISIMADGSSDEYSKEAFDRMLTYWEQFDDKPFIYKAQEITESGPYAKAHPKVVVVDGRQLIVGSANFTWHGLNSNIEIGLYIKGDIAAQMQSVLKRLVELKLYKSVLDN